MKQAIYLIIAGMMVVTTVLFSGCSSSGPEPVKEQQDALEKRPDWTSKTPPSTDTTHFFVGLSEVYRDESKARDDSYRNAANRVIGFVGSSAKVKFEKRVVAYGLSGGVIDPIGASKELETFLSESVVSNLKEDDTYPEIEKTSSGKAYKYFMLTSITKQSLNEPTEKFFEKKKKEAEEQKRKGLLKDQADNVIKFWDSTKDDPFFKNK